jgi:hypothetical protein
MPTNLADFRPWPLPGPDAPRSFSDDIYQRRAPLDVLRGYGLEQMPPELAGIIPPTAWAQMPREMKMEILRAFNAGNRGEQVTP